MLQRNIKNIYTSVSTNMKDAMKKLFKSIIEILAYVRETKSKYLNAKHLTGR